MATSKITLALVVSLFVAGLTIRSRAQSTDHEIAGFRPHEIIVEIKPGGDIDAINERNGTATIERIKGTNFYRLRTPANVREEKWRRRMERDEDVISASLNPVISCPTNVFARATVAFPGDRANPGRTRLDYFHQPDLFELLKLSDAQLRSRGAGITVAVIDTGIDRSHPDVVSKLWKDNRQAGELAPDGFDEDGDGLVDDLYGWDFVDNDNDPTETGGDPSGSIAGHGSFIAGLISLVAPEARILPIRAFTPDGTSNSFTVAAAIKYAADHGARVINLSFGSPRKSSIVRDAVRYARQRGSVLVAAMGNDDTDIDRQYPANFSDVIGVAAIDRDSRKAVFSNFGRRVSVAAPGVDLISTYPGADYATWSGTSFATPFTAAQAALLFSQSPRIDVRRITEQTADSIDFLNPGYSGKLGRGRINPFAALEIIYNAEGPSGNYASLALRPSTGRAMPRGQAEKLVTGSLQQLRITGLGLNARTGYELLINGKKISPVGISASNFGGLAVELSNKGASPDETGWIHLDLPPDLDPITEIKRVELRDADRTVLEADFSPVAGGSDQFISKRASLASTGVLSQAAGKAIILFSRTREELRVEGKGLTPGATYGAFADGASLGSAVAQAATTSSGFLRLRLTDDGSSEYRIPASLRPLMSIKHIELRDSLNRMILRGDFLPGGE